MKKSFEEGKDQKGWIVQKIKGGWVCDIDGVFKGSELSNCSNLVFLRNSQNGKVIAKVNQKSINLNSELHKND